MSKSHLTFAGSLSPPGTDEPYFAEVIRATGGNKLISAKEAAGILSVSECWVRRHQAQLPIVRIGSLIRFDETLLRRDLACRIPREKPLKLRGETMSYQIRR